MLQLSVSVQPCVPGKPLKVASTRARPTRCETCGAPGGAGGVLLEPHQVATGKHKFLCPLCHMCLHLDVAGRKKAGRVIWLPEISQEQLNLMCLSMFVAFSRAGVYRNHEHTKGIVDSAARLYAAFERRSESIEICLGGTAVRSLMPRQSLSSPTHIASLLVRVKRESKLTARELALRVDGMRLLPAPKPFETYVDAVSRIVTAKFPVTSWTERVNTILDAREAAAQDETAAHFDAEPALN